MSEYSMSELRDMAPAYVLGALAPAEHAAFETALSSSPELVAEVADFRKVVEHLGTAQKLAPPPALRARFLEQIATGATANGDQSGSRTTGARATATGPADASSSTAPKIAPSAPPQLSVSRGSREAAPAAPPFRWWLSGALATALAASLVFAVRRNTDVERLTSELAARDSIIRMRDLALGQRDTTLNTLLGTDQDLLVVNAGSAPTAGPGMQFFWNLKQGRGVLHTFRLKPAGPGRAYQLWLIKDGKPIASKVFNSNANNDGLVWDIELPKETTGVSAVAITEEPASGSQQPTTTPFLIGALAKRGL